MSSELVLNDSAATFACRALPRLTHGEGSLLMVSTLPVPQHFHSSDLSRNSTAVFDAARASFSTQRPHLAVAELHSWRETAEAIAAGLGEVETEWLDEDIAVERP